MKNIHLLPTEKPSRLGQVHEKLGQVYEKLSFFKDRTWDNTENWRCKNIYITNSEEIKEGQNYIGDGFSGKNKFKWHKSQIETYPNIKKDVIVLTTDQDLIKDGVQAIDDTFLEWFVKNPSCESVEVETTRERNGYHSKHKKRYKIIIPKEEPKQETIEELDYNKIIEQSLVELRKQPMSFVPDKIMYSEEELKSAFKIGFNIGYGSHVSELDLKQQHCDRWFEQFKKK